MGEDPKTPPALDAVSLEIIVIGSEDRGQGLADRKSNERRVREIHGSIVIFSHESVELGQIGVVDGQHPHRARTQERPGGYPLVPAVPY